MGFFLAAEGELSESDIEFRIRRIEDIRNLRKIDWVVKGGERFTQKSLQALVHTR